MSKNQNERRSTAGEVTSNVLQSMSRAAQAAFADKDSGYPEGALVDLSVNGAAMNAVLNHPMVWQGQAMVVQSNNHMTCIEWASGDTDWILTDMLKAV